MLSRIDVDSGIFIAIGGPSGAGKSTVINGITGFFGERIYGSITYTTRTPRKGEIDGVNYRFVKASEITKYQNDSRYTNFVSARGYWYWIDSVDLIETSRRNSNGIYLTAITQVKEFIERRQIFPNLHWIWLTASSNELCARLKARGDKDIYKSQAHNELLEKEDRSKLISLEVNTSGIKLDTLLGQIIHFMEKLMEVDYECDSNHMQ